MVKEVPKEVVEGKILPHTQAAEKALQRAKRAFSIRQRCAVAGISLARRCASLTALA